MIQGYECYGVKCSLQYILIAVGIHHKCKHKVRSRRLFGLAFLSSIEMCVFVYVNRSV